MPGESGVSPISRHNPGKLCHSVSCGLGWHLLEVPEVFSLVEPASSYTGEAPVCHILHLPLSVVCDIMVTDLAPALHHQWDALPALSTEYLHAMHQQIESVDFALNMQCGRVMVDFRTWIVSLPDKAFTGNYVSEARAILVWSADSCLQLSDIRCEGAAHSNGSLGPSTTSDPQAYLRLAHISSIQTSKHSRGTTTCYKRSSLRARSRRHESKQPGPPAYKMLPTVRMKF